MTPIAAAPTVLFAYARPPARVDRALDTEEPTTGIRPPAAYLAARRDAESDAEATTVCRAITADDMALISPRPKVKAFFILDATFGAPLSPKDEMRLSASIQEDNGSKSFRAIAPTTPKTIFIFIA